MQKVTLSAGVWTEIPVTNNERTLVVQNTSEVPVLVNQSTSQPSGTSDVGFTMPGGYTYLRDDVVPERKIWVRSTVGSAIIMVDLR